ncbi:ribonuclease PH [soil metagenome]
MSARTGRAPDGLRALIIRRGVNRHAEGSALVEWGDTHVLATVSIEARLPPHLRGKGSRSGWLNAEYAMLPRATALRKPRERPSVGGRTQEIQRLIGRALRASVDLHAFANRTLTVDVDVLQADGGTRCAGVLAGYAALFDLADAAVFAGTLTEWPLRHEVAAVSVGLVDGEVLVDLDYAEDVRAAVDLNVVATATGEVIEVQGGGEGEIVDAERYVQLVAVGISAVERLALQVRGMLR